MTKEEKIKEAWGKLMPDYTNIDLDNGWSKYSFKMVYRDKFDLKREKDIHVIRPKSLRGIENNNGWIKIESEADLPKQNGLYDVVCNGIMSVLEFFDNGKVKGFIHIGETFINKYNEIGVTHYQSLEQRKQPIY